jgi:predicted ABC-type ATPase
VNQPVPVLHLLAGPNGAGKSTYQRLVLSQLGLPWVNADEIAAQRWPADPLSHGHDASRLAAEQRDSLLDQKASLVDNVWESIYPHGSFCRMGHPELALCRAPAGIFMALIMIGQFL